MFLRMEEKYKDKVDSSGHRNLSVAESFELVAEFGLLHPVSTAAKNSISTSITKPTEFDGVSAAAYVKDNVSDETLCRLGRLIPKELTPQEKVRFLEHLVASVPNDHSEARSCSVSANASTSTSVGDSDRNRTDILVEVDTQDGNDSVFSMYARSCLSSQSDQSQVRINWTEDQVRLLVELRRQFEHLFASSVVSQKQAWKKVAEEMAEKGYCYSGDDCQRKFSSLRLRHKTIKDRNNKTGRGRSTWKFYTIMEEMFGGDPEVEPLVEVSSMPQKKKQAPPIQEREISDCVCDDTLMTLDIAKTPVKTSNCAIVKTTPKTSIWLHWLLHCPSSLKCGSNKESITKREWKWRKIN